jgi:multisubunit Na+/H+ antiporter MnhC subunit
MKPAGKRMLLGLAVLLLAALAFFFAFGYFAGRTAPELPLREASPTDVRLESTPAPTNPGDPAGTVGLK